MNAKKVFNKLNNFVEISNKDLKRYALWVSSISASELDGAMLSGIQSQISMGKSKEECVKYLYRNFKKELSEIITFNNEMGINLQ